MSAGVARAGDTFDTGESACADEANDVGVTSYRRTPRLRIFSNARAAPAAKLLGSDIGGLL